MSLKTCGRKSSRHSLSLMLLFLFFFNSVFVFVHAAVVMIIPFAAAFCDISFVYYENLYPLQKKKIKDR